MQLGKNFWKFNSSLINDEKYVTQIKQHISEVKSQFNCFWKQNSCSAGIFKIWNLEIYYRILKNKANLKREKWSRLKVKLKELEQNLSKDEAKEKYNAYRDKINEIYDQFFFYSFFTSI